MKKILFIMILRIFYAQVSYSDAYIKLICDKGVSDVYVNGEIVGTYDDMPLEFILPSGKHLVEIKKDYGDGSYGYYKKTVKVGTIDIKVPINASLEKEYTEEYYLGRATTISGAEKYLDKYPKGKYSTKVKDFIELEYSKKATTIRRAEEYLEKYPKGKYASKVKAFIEMEYVKKADSIEGAESYLERYPNGKYSGKIKNFIEMEYVKKVTTIEEAERYLEKYPRGKYSSKVRNFIEAEYAKKADTMVGIEKYISKYPNNPKTKELKKQLGEKYYERIRNYPRSFFGIETIYKTGYNDDKYVKNSLYTYARSSETEEPLIVLQYAIKYLKLFPNGKYSDVIKEKNYFLVSERNEYKLKKKSIFKTARVKTLIDKKTIKYSDDYEKMIIDSRRRGYMVESETYKSEFTTSKYESSVDGTEGVFHHDWNNKSFIEKLPTFYDKEGRLNVINEYEAYSRKCWMRFIYKDDRLIKIYDYSGAFEGHIDEQNDHYEEVRNYYYNSKGLLERIETYKKYRWEDPDKEKNDVYSEFTYDSYGNLIKFYEENRSGDFYQNYTYKHYKVNENGEVMELSGVSQI